jgi:general stress protein YciG
MPKRNVDPNVLREAGRKGGEKVSQNRQHMADIGRRGGIAVAQNRQHMADIGRRGGRAVAQNRQHMAEIGHKGGETVREKYGSGFYSEIGKKGGDRVSQNREHMAEIGRKGGESRSRDGNGMMPDEGHVRAPEGDEASNGEGASLPSSSGVAETAGGEGA